MIQINTILVNIYFGPIVNTARAISLQFSSAFSSFTNNFIVAFRTPMIKSYAEESFLYLNNLFNLSNKFIYYSLLMIFLPLFFEMNTILFLWLKSSDPQTVLFCRLILIYALIMSLNNPISIIIQATGHVKEYHVAVEIFTLLCVPLTYIFFKLGYPAYYSYLIMIFTAIASHIVRLISLKKYYNSFSYYEYIISFIFPAFIITLISSTALFFVHISIINTSFRLIVVFLLSIICVTMLTLILGLSKTEKKDIKNLIFSN